MKFVPTETIDLGNSVYCDACGEDYTESKQSGGFLFGSKAYCPKCATESLPKIKYYNEEAYIKAYCPEDLSFAEFVLKLRDGNNLVQTGYLL